MISGSKTECPFQKYSPGGQNPAAGKTLPAFSPLMDSSSAFAPSTVINQLNAMLGATRRFRRTGEESVNGP